MTSDVVGTRLGDRGPRRQQVLERASGAGGDGAVLGVGQRLEHRNSAEIPKSSLKTNTRKLSNGRP